MSYSQHQQQIRLVWRRPSYPSNDQTGYGNDADADAAAEDDNDVNAKFHDMGCCKNMLKEQCLLFISTTETTEFQLQIEILPTNID
ncbi:hypothetical protein DPMN_114525 [Dreissena polymorpha]|uniref:Uncharacterized protein n=1 Tax=Dreissena polymorpha TaxID=45954 RepID=A0A9D4QSJ8_DREPO|nr:hypothetical protein DPMN_114525 [Dreissena polymorpha]